MKKIMLYLLVFVGILLVGLVQGASYPAPFVVGGSADVSMSSTTDGTTGTVTGGDSVMIAKSSDSDEKQDCRDKGCSEDGRCYPFGYRLDEEFCAIEYIVRDKEGRERYAASNVFVKQSNTSVICSNNFECLTNLCMEGICINLTEEINRQVDIKTKELKTELIADVEEKLASLNQVEEDYVNNTSSNETQIETKPVKIDLAKRFLNWLKNILS